MRTMIAIALVSLIVAGCGAGADENKSLADVKAEAASLDVDGLRAQAEAYYDALKPKLKEFEKLTSEAAEKGGEALGDMLGGAADEGADDLDALKEKMAALGKSIEALTERFEVYYDELKKKGGDVSGLDL